MTPTLNRESDQNAEPGRAICGFLHRAEPLVEPLLRRKPNEIDSVPFSSVPFSSARALPTLRHWRIIPA